MQLRAIMLKCESIKKKRFKRENRWFDHFELKFGGWIEIDGWKIASKRKPFARNDRERKTLLWCHLRFYSQDETREKKKSVSCCDFDEVKTIGNSWIVFVDIQTTWCKWVLIIIYCHGEMEYHFSHEYFYMFKSLSMESTNEMGTEQRKKSTRTHTHTHWEMISFANGLNGIENSIGLSLAAWVFGWTHKAKAAAKNVVFNYGLHVFSCTKRTLSH